MQTTFRIKLSWENVYLLLFSVYSFFYIFDASLIGVGTIMKMLKIGCSAGLILVYVSHKKFTLKKLILSLIVLLTFFLASYTSDRSQIFMAALFILCAEVSDFKKIVTISLICTFSMTCLIMLAAKVGVLPDYTFVRGNVFAHSMGFSYYSTYPYIFLFNMLSYMYIRKKPLTLIEIALMFLVNLYIYRLSTLRLSFYLSIGVLVLYLILVKADKLNLNCKLIRTGAVVVYPVMFALALYTSLFYNEKNRLWRGLNDALSGRLALQSEAFNRYHVTLFGQNIETRTIINGNITQLNYFYIDSGFIYALLGYGVVLTGITIFMYSFLLHDSCKKNDKVLAIWLVVLACFTVINNVWLVLYYNSVLLLFMRAFYQKASIQERIRKALKYGTKEKL